MSTNELFTGQEIGPYRLSRHLDRGGMADVYVALDTSLNREVILKVMLPMLIGDKTFVARFQREARITAGLNHPNIVQGV